MSSNNDYDEEGSEYDSEDQQREEGEISDDDEEGDINYSVPDIGDVLRKHGDKWALVYKGLQQMLAHPNIGLSKLTKEAQAAFYEWVYEHAYLQTHYPLE